MKRQTVQERRRRRAAGRLRRAGRAVLGALVLALCLSAPQTAGAASSQTVYSSSGKAMFTFNVLDVGTKPSEADPGMVTHNRAITGEDMIGVTAAAGLWADLLGPYSSNSEPLVIEVVGSNIYNAAAESYTTMADGLEGTRALRQISAGLDAGLGSGYVEVGIGSTAQSLFSVSGKITSLSTGQADLTPVVFHELGHLLGMGSNGLGKNSFGQDKGAINEWDTHLYDRYGTKASYGLSIVRYEEGKTYDSSVFVVGDFSVSGVTFRGDNVSEVLQGALGGGVPINGFEGGGIEEEEEEEEPGGGSASGLLSVSLLSDTSGTEESGSESAEGGSGESSGSSDDSWTADLSHIELAHSLMSHQQWRNWTTLMEAEIAVMQDLGYQIDRRNWYGHSVYGDGLTITNTNGFWARNAEGTAYLEGEANTATLGVGLHVYGSNNIITQAADLLACGLAGTGIRIEGAGNTLTVAEGVTVAADGTGGTGLMVSYGKNHTVVSNGAIRATGDSGIAVRFDFGGNMLGDAIEYRGSWMRTVYNSTTKETESVALRDSDGNAVTDGKYGLALNLDGPLVSRFAVSGSLEGSAAAIYIAANAYVEQMDILSGASITGNIVSNWNPVDSRVQYATLNAGHSNTELTTKLTFGLAATDQGIGGDTGDANFAMVYDGAIAGSSSLQIEVAGGALEYNGQASVLSVTVDEGASLSGTGSYTLSSISDGTKTVGGTFTNAGTYSPGSGLSAGDGAQAIAAARITGNYTQARTGTLVTSFNAAGTSDVLTVSGRASMDGTIALTPVRDYYANGDLGLALSDIVRAGTLSVSDSLGADILNASPTLTMALTTVSSSKDAEYTISMSRAADAYSQYAASGQQAELAASLDEFGQTDLTTASGDLGDARNLLSALDFSASDGTALPGAYKELGPDAYTKAGQASLALQRSLTGQIVNGRLLAPASGQASGASGRPARAMAAGDESAGTGLRVFATPMGGRTVSDREGGSDTSWYGLLAGAETDLSLGGDNLTLGVHAAFLHTEGSANDNDASKGDNIALGLHGRWDPALSLDAGSLGSVAPYVMGLVRGGLETRHMEREVSFNGYNRKAESDWTAPTLSAMLGTGLDFRPCDTLVFGPVLWLDYTAMWRPSVEEDGGLASDLDLDAATYQSLRSSLGARMNVRLHDGPDTLKVAGSLDLSLTAVWNHEYLYDNGGTKASFAHFGSTSFTDRADVADRDSFSGLLQLTGHLTEDVTLSLFGGLEQGRHTSDAKGGASLTWSF